MTKNIKVAVIGAGMMGKNHMKTYKSLNGVELVGVYDIFPEAASRRPKLRPSGFFVQWRKSPKTLKPSALLPLPLPMPTSANFSSTKAFTA